jgi:hypothetical protein
MICLTIAAVFSFHAAGWECSVRGGNEPGSGIASAAMKHILISIAGAFLFAQAVFAADSAFSKDGRHVYLIAYNRPGLVDLDLQGRACGMVDLGKSFKEPVKGVTLSNTGFILCATKAAIWVYDPATAKCIKVCDAPKGFEMDDIAYDASIGDIYCTARQKEVSGQLYCWPKGGNKWEHVYNRYDSGVYHPVFSAEGGLYFVVDGDLWAGFIGKEPKDSETGLYATVNAYRCAPLASMITENTSPASSGLHSVSLTQHSIYAEYSRMGGSGWGAVVRFKKPVAFTVTNGERDDPPVNEGDWKDVQAIFASIEVISDTPCDTLCTSPDGLVTVYTNADSRSDSKVFIVQGDGKPDTVEFKGLADLLK